MRLSEPRRIFQIVGLTACVVVVFPGLSEFFFQLPAEVAKFPDLAAGWRQLLTFAWMTGSPTLYSIGLAAAFWWTTQMGPIEGRWRHLALGLLILQLFLALNVNADLLFIVGAEIPFVLRGRTAFFWLGAQCIATGAYILILAVARSRNLVIVGMDHTPRPLTLALGILVVTAFNIFAFGCGYLVVREETGRHLLVRTNAELRATQVLLDNSSRLGERLRIARELHDAIGHRLAALSIHLQLASRLVSGPAAEPVYEAHQVTTLLLREVRNVVGAVRDERVINLRQALEILTRDIPHPRIHLSLADELNHLDSPRAHNLFRAVQEAVTNAIRHSGARNVWITVGSYDGGWEFNVSDDGIGADEITAGNGLRGIRERMEEFGGSLHIVSRTGEGFRLYGTLPTEDAVL